MMTMNGFYGRILEIDLSAERFVIRPFAEDLLRECLGGKGLASRLLAEVNPVGVDPLAPENRLIFATGPLTGSRIWGSSRYGVFSKSPQTGIYSESYSGGRVPEAIDACGFDALVISGRSPGPVVLYVHPDGAEIHPAGELWGRDTYASEELLRTRFRRKEGSGVKRGCVVIGPAGENLVRFAVIENDFWRSAGRTGLGAVMGAKKLKGIAFEGDRSRSAADPKAVSRLAREIAELGREHPGVQAYKRLGTPMMVKIMNEAGAFPTRYWSRGRDDGWPGIGAEALHERCLVKPHSCLKCFMACGRLTTVRSGRHAGLRIEGPEYETIYAFGGLCQVREIEEIAYLNDLCDRLGLDTITAGNLCAFTIEAVRRGRLDYAIAYGEVEAIAGLLREIAARRGPVGDLLADGIRAAAAAWGLEDLAVHVKGLEPAGYDPRVLKGMGLGYATSDRGACHLRSTFYKAELSGMIGADETAGKAKLFLDFENRLTLFDCLILCRFYRDLYGWERLVEIIEAVCGLGLDQKGLEKTALRIADQVRRFNLREGMAPAADRLPPALHRPLADSGAAISAGELKEMLNDYYRLHGWDDEGRPLPPTSEQGNNAEQS
jgi:aldehyde:ferredoxin oxidoreductase